jgi:hypothetical protein
MYAARLLGQSEFCIPERSAGELEKTPACSLYRAKFNNPRMVIMKTKQWYSLPRLEYFRNIQVFLIGVCDLIRFSQPKGRINEIREGWPQAWFRGRAREG